MKRFLQRYWIGFQKFLSAAKWVTVIPLARLVGGFRRRRQIISVWPKTPVMLRPKIVIFMHFDRYGRLRDHLVEYMKEFAYSGRSVVFVTNAGMLPPEVMARLQKICAVIIVRRNRGYDFGAWRDVIEQLNLPRAETEEVILANDSVFGPLRPLADMLSKLDYARTDIWGLTESWQYRYHLQSFFIAFGPAALRSPAWAKFWNSVRPVPAKVYIVKTYEIGVTQTMMKAGLRCDAIWSYERLLRMVNASEIERISMIEETAAGKMDPVNITRKLHALRIRGAAASRTALNPTADLWRQLLLTGFPFLKRELLRDNPTNVEDISDWTEMVRETLGIDPETILRDLRLMLKDQAP